MKDRCITTEMKKYYHSLDFNALRAAYRIAVDDIVSSANENEVNNLAWFMETYVAAKHISIIGDKIFEKAEEDVLNYFNDKPIGILIPEENTDDRSRST